MIPTRVHCLCVRCIAGGVRGTFKIFRSCLAGLLPGMQDIKESQIGPSGESAQELAAADVPPIAEKAVAGAAAQPHVAAHHGPPEAHIMWVPQGGRRCLHDVDATRQAV